MFISGQLWADDDDDDVEVSTGDQLHQVRLTADPRNSEEKARQKMMAGKISLSRTKNVFQVYIRILSAGVLIMTKIPGCIVGSTCSLFLFLYRTKDTRSL